MNAPHLLRTPRAVIFDMDGVLADTEPIHEIAMQTVLSRRGHRIEPADYARLVGLGHQTAWAWLRGRFGLTEDQRRLDAEYESLLLPLLTTHARPAAGVCELISILGAEGVSLAVASSSPRSVVAATLDALGLTHKFSVTISGDDVSKGKPDPEIFLVAAERLGVSAKRCVAIEDSPHGMLAAHAAGMRVIGVRTRYTADVALPADMVVASLSETLALVAAGACCAHTPPSSSPASSD